MDQLVIAPAPLPLEIDLGMHNPHVPSKRIVPAERLVLTAILTPDLLLAAVVDRVLVASQIVRPAEDGIARLAGARVDARALVRTNLAVAGQEGAARQAGAGGVG